MNKITKFITLPVLAIGVAALAIGMTVDAPETSGIQDPTAGPRGACGHFIRESLNNPSSYEAVDSLNWSTNFRDDGIITVAATYRATNSFGAVVTETTYCDIVAEGSDYRLQALR